MNCISHSILQNNPQDIPPDFLREIPQDTLVEIISHVGGRGALNLAMTARDWWTQRDELLRTAGLTLAHGAPIIPGTTYVSSRPHEYACIPSHYYHGILRASWSVWELHAFGTRLESFIVVCIVPRNCIIRRNYMVNGRMYTIEYTLTYNDTAPKISNLLWSYKDRYGCVRLSGYDCDSLCRLSNRVVHNPHTDPFGEKKFIEAQLARPSRLALLFEQGALP
jgi:hypothetical protein